VPTTALASVGTGGISRVLFGIERQRELIIGFDLRAEEAAQTLSHGGIVQHFHEEYILSLWFFYG
jgi:hypothetical protein